MDDDPALPIDPDLEPSDPSGRGRLRPDVLAAIALGGMIGATARYGVAQWLPTPHGRFPWATFWTNVSGSFLLGLLLVVIVNRRPHRSRRRLARPFAATGILGAFTTMSTFEVETALLLKDGHAPTAVLYLTTSLVAGLTLAYAGILTGRQIRRRGAASS